MNYFYFFIFAEAPYLTCIVQYRTNNYKSMYAARKDLNMIVFCFFLFFLFFFFFFGFFFFFCFFFFFVFYFFLLLLFFFFCFFFFLFFKTMAKEITNELDNRDVLNNSSNELLNRISDWVSEDSG